MITYIARSPVAKQQMSYTLSIADKNYCDMQVKKEQGQEELCSDKTLISAKVKKFVNESTN